MDIREKIYNYFNTSKELHVLFIFDPMAMLQSEIEADTTAWPEEYHYEVFEGNWFTTKVRLATEWKEKKVVLLFPGRLEPTNQTDCVNFPLLSVLKANMVFHEEDAISFMQQRGIPMQFDTFFKRHIDELRRDRYDKVMAPYYDSKAFNLDCAYRGLLSVYLDSSRMLEWYQIVAQIIIISASEDGSKADDFWYKLRPSAKSQTGDVQMALAETFQQIVGMSYDTVTSQPMKKVAEAMKYNALTQRMVVSQTDPYKQLKIENSIQLQQLNTMLSAIGENSKLNDAFVAALAKLGKDVKEETLLDVYGTDAPYTYMSERLCRLITQQMLKDGLYARPQQVEERLTQMSDNAALSDTLKAALAYYQKVAHFYVTINEIETLKLNAPDVYIDKYVHQFYAMDMYYRQAICGYAELAIEEKNEEVEQIKARMDIDYAAITNDLNQEWLRCIKEKGTGFETITAVERQPDFFQKHIGVPKLKTAVIVSDALRYEMAVELLGRLTGKKHVATLEAALAMLPTETKYCKPSLLPHKDLVCTGTDMTVDGKTLNTSEQRTAHLKKYVESAVCVSYDQLMQWPKAERRDVFKNKLVYVFHNTIDNNCHGCNLTTYAATCRNALDELMQLIGFIHDTANVTEVYLTADHGYLYNDTPFEEKDKLALAEETLEKKTRYFICKNEAEEFGITKFPMQGVSMMQGDFYVGVPTGTNRLAKEGGDYQFAHGGASLQELIIPVLHSKYQAINKKGKVSVSLLESVLTITSSRLKAHLVQGEAVSMTKQEQTVVCAVYVGDEAVTPMKEITLNSTDEEMVASRIYEVDLTLKQAATSKIMQFKVFKQGDMLNPVIVKNIVNNTLIEQDDF